MNRQKGLNLIELSIVLVILSLLLGGATHGFKIWKERAEYLAEGRGGELERLIALDKRVIDRLDAPIPSDPVDPSDPVPEVEPEAEFVESDPVDRRPRWVRWIQWWKNLGWSNNSRSNRNG